MPLKLSEAIRLGAMLKPQCTESYFDGIGTCAMGAAFDALGKLDHALSNDAAALAYAKFQMTQMMVPHPVTHEILGLTSVIFRLNDLDKWTREQIADWVEQIERAQEPTSQPASRDWIGSVKS